MKIKTILSAAALAAVSVNAQAGRDVEQIYKECGIGGLIFGSVSPIVAVISNVTWDLGTTAFSSEASSPDTCYKGDAKTAAFINETQQQLEQDLAKGHGDYVDALVAIANCDDQQAAVQAMRTSVSIAIEGDAYLDASPSEKSAVIYNAVNAEATCSI